MKKQDVVNENFAKLCEQIGGRNCEGAKQYRADNRRLEKRRRKSYQTRK